MHVLKVLARVAFLCNMCFLAAALILWLPNPPEGSVVSTVIVMGFLMGLPVNAAVFGWALLRVAGKWRVQVLPRGIMLFNFIVFCLQFIYLIQRLR
ncbi:MAG TPA: hypothetical protein VN616_16505 [Puia sp.]|nr:hypothetical protein [Puia sp.]